MTTKRAARRRVNSEMETLVQTALPAALYRAIRVRCVEHELTVKAFLRDAACRYLATLGDRVEGVR